MKFGCTGQHVRCEDDIMKLVEAGNNHRKVAETNMNVQSSRSHAILQIVSNFPSFVLRQTHYCVHNALNLDLLTFMHLHVLLRNVSPDSEEV